ncbi:MAG: T9SS type A sorting domain-containing protein, partial [Candidatus Aegiribacteria sp.]|nr:T9SS type A sorting domain-containing protein [Candidatus Aegiribacteria sp.]MBD3294670.1 T9SS type A sorting domain-containing protein [Candidatus Fermentibacteria bacterium]
YGQIAHEKLLLSSDVEVIENDGRQAVMIFASCDLGHFDMTSTDCLSEKFALEPDGGAIATIGATRGTYGSSNEDLFEEYFQTYYEEEGCDVSSALWKAKVTLSSYYNSKYYVIMGDGGVMPVLPDSSNCTFSLAEDSLYRGRINSVSASLNGSSTGLVEVTESGSNVTYNGLGGGSVDYLRYGAAVYSGLVTGSQGDFTVSFFAPVQADTGSLSRGALLGLSSSSPEVGYREWMELVDDGDYTADSLPPEIEMWIRGHRGQTDPTVGVQPVVCARIADSSGVCSMGGGAGRSVLLSLDGQGFDVSGSFEYRSNSYTEGELEYELPVVVEGDHRLIIAAWDGMGNAGRDTLDFSAVSSPGQLLADVFVYPNPSPGARCFNFETSAEGTASISVFTVAGRLIWRKTVNCSQGYNQVMWNGRDMDNDELGSGSYIYKVEFSSNTGAGSSVTDILAVIRES